MKTKLRAAALVAGMLGLCVTAQAIINPNFTPIDLVKDSDTILLLEFDTANDKGVATATVKKVLKGKYEPKKLSVDFMAGIVETAGREATDLIARGQHEALLFIGSFQVQGDAGAGGYDMDGEQQAKGYLQIGGEWTDHTQHEWFILDQGQSEEQQPERSGHRSVFEQTGNHEDLLTAETEPGGGQRPASPRQGGMQTRYQSPYEAASCGKTARHVGPAGGGTAGP